MEQFTNLSTNLFMTTEKTMSVSQITTILLLSMALSSILFITYKLANTKLTYNKRFNVTLVMIAFISTILMSLIQTNLMLSVGMLGSLSIVRFRTNIKDTRDVGFIFWALAIGITSATGNYFIGTVASVIMSAFMLLTSNESKNNEALLLVVRGEDADLKLIEDIVNQAKGTHKVKAKNILSDSFELVYELKVARDEDNKIIDRLLSIRGIDGVNILAPNTEVV